MTEEKEEFCFPKLKEDIVKTLLRLGVISVAVIVTTLLGMWFLLDTALAPNNKCITENCFGPEYTFMGSVIIGVLLLCGFAVFGSVWYVISSLINRYWITEKECYGDEKK